MSSEDSDITIKLGKKLPKATVHSLPCKIHHDGQAKISEYFTAQLVTNQNNELETSLRGRPLRGEEIVLGENIQGYVIQQNSDIKWTSTKKVDKVNNWVLDKNPKDERVLKGSLEWFDIANALHTPIKNTK